MANPQDRIPADEYRRLQRSLPGMETLYDLLRVTVDTRAVNGDRVLIVGAGGGREIETLAASPLDLHFVGVDPSAPMLDLARHHSQTLGVAARTTLIEGLIDAVPVPLAAGFATSILVMHFLADDGAKAAYLAAIRARMRPGATLFLADISPTDAAEFAAMQPLFLAHAELMGLEAERMAEGVAMIARLPLVGSTRIRQLLIGAGFSAVTPLFQGLWYRAWIATLA